jgi:hypothetical protein
MMAAAGSQESGVAVTVLGAGAVLGAGTVLGAAGVDREGGPGGVGSEELVLGAGEIVGVRLGGGGDGGDRTRGGVRRRGGTYKSSSSPTPLRSSTSHRLLAAFLVRFAGSGDGAVVTLVASARGRAARVARARAGSMGAQIGLAGEICRGALRH